MPFLGIHLHLSLQKGFFMWVRRLIELTDWEPLDLTVDWESIERELQLPLPADYKELFEAFGGGVFCESVFFLARSDALSFDLLAQWRASVAAEEEGDPYPVYSPGGKGVIEWAATEWADQYCWLVDAERPGEFSILARGDVGEWYSYEMSTSEFLYRVLADEEFKPFGIAEYGLDPMFQPGRSADGS
ncbi:SMI1/KNR4 family protein [Streptomyces sp. NPDC047821]|uniref:SMI1/KNR4 family protein n=1 Tax=Streptomyces sp. NPDC047821 TaxID=3365488 RepID=UPI00371C0B2E